MTTGNQMVITILVSWLTVSTVRMESRVKEIESRVKELEEAQRATTATIGTIVKTIAVAHGCSDPSEPTFEVWRADTVLAYPMTSGWVNADDRGNR